MGRSPEGQPTPGATPPPTPEQNPFAPPLWGINDDGCRPLGGEDWLKWEREHRGPPENSPPPPPPPTKRE